MCYLIPSLVKCPCVVPGNSWRDGRPDAPGDPPGVLWGIYMKLPGFPPGYPTRDSLGGIPLGIPTISPRDRPGPWDISWWPLQGTPNPSPRALEVQSWWSAVKDRSEKDSTYQFSLYRMCLLFALVVYRTHVLSLCLADRN
jgi:hypothetical protein